MQVLNIAYMDGMGWEKTSFPVFSTNFLSLAAWVTG